MLPILFKTSYDFGVSFSPNNSTVPVVGFQIFVIIFITVVFPAPFGASIYRQPPQHRINQGF